MRVYQGVFRPAAAGVNMPAYDDPTAAGLTLLATETGIDATATGDTAIYTVPADRSLLVGYCSFEVTAVTGYTSAPTVSVGANASVNDIYTNTALTGLDTLNEVLTLSTTDPLVSISAGDVVSLRVATGATATTLTLTMRLYGRLV